MFPPLDGVTHRFVELPGLRMHVAEAGSGDAVVMLHGFPQHWWEWRDVIPAVAEHYRVICPDLRGAGWTDAPADGYMSSQLQADVLALLDALDLDQVHLVTHDWSSILGYLTCFDHPERVRDHVAMAVPPPGVKLDGGFAGRALRHGWFNLVLDAYRGRAMTTPTRVLIGADDRVVKAVFEGAIEVPGASHFLVDDRPDLVADQVLEFIKS
jgi:pimeloyl-ACP methyl ester carboxylesterase